MEILWALVVVGGIGIIAGVGLTVAGKYFSVPTDPKIEKIRSALPGANCGSCGFAGCDDYAKAIAEGKAEPGLCSPGGEKTSAELSEILGTKIVSVKRTAFVACRGVCDVRNQKNYYSGLESCAAANMLYSGPSECKFGCIGLGDCQKVCEHNAIAISCGVANVDPNNCIGCAKCQSVCPKSIISMIPDTNSKRVLCSNKNKGAAAKKVCKNACIGCGICQKQCEFEAISVADNLANINPELCTGCGKCMEKCPQKCIM